MADADQIKALLAEHQDRIDEGYTPREQTSSPPEGKFVVDLVFSGEFLQHNKNTGAEFVSIPTYFHITDVLSLSDRDFTEEEILRDKGLRVYGPSLSTDSEQEWTRDGFFGLASLIAGEDVTTLAVAHSVIKTALAETKKTGRPYRFHATGKRNKKGYVNLSIQRVFVDSVPD